MRQYNSVVTFHKDLDKNISYINQLKTFDEIFLVLNHNPC
jgi:hypothetical protein